MIYHFKIKNIKGGIAMNMLVFDPAIGAYRTITVTVVTP